MSDLIDVSNALTAIIVQTVYPNGIGQPSLTGPNVAVKVGWMTSPGLDQDLAAGKVNVTVYPKNEERNTTRYQTNYHTTFPAAPTLTTSVSGQQVTIGGTLSAPQNVGISVNSIPYVYAVQPSDTLTSIATALAALIGNGTTNSGAVITLPNTAQIGAVRIGASATVAREFKRQEKIFQITVWANDPKVRDQIAAPIDTALAQIPFLSMPDGFGARLIYKNTMQTDALQKENLYRRDINYCVEWATTISEKAPQVVFTKTNVSSDCSPPTTTYL